MEETSKEKRSIGNGKVAILSGYALILLFLFAFGCYGCAYQSPFDVPEESEAQTTLRHLGNTAWRLDSAAGEATLPELGGMVITTVSFDADLDPDGTLRASLGVKGRMPMVAHLRYDAEHGIVMEADCLKSPVKVSVSSSKDGKNETITFKGRESNTQCYYLRT